MVPAMRLAWHRGNGGLAAAAWRFGTKGAACVFAMVWASGCKIPNTVPKDGLPATKKHDPVAMSGFDFIESFFGEPAEVGCADGQREGFAELAKFPNIAGCLGIWQGRKSLQDPKTDRACGDDLKGASQYCRAPADLCAPGWRICASQGLPRDLRERTSAQDCQEGAGPGRFVAGISHGQEKRICPSLPQEGTKFPCFEQGICSEPVCCGDDCQFGACRDGVWRGQTKISRGVPHGCGAVISEHHGGVLCCREERVPRVDPTKIRGDLSRGLPPQKEKKAAKQDTVPTKKGAADASQAGGQSSKSEAKQDRSSAQKRAEPGAPVGKRQSSASEPPKREILGPLQAPPDPVLLPQSQSKSKSKLKSAEPKPASKKGGQSRASRKANRAGQSRRP